MNTPTKQLPATRELNAEVVAVNPLSDHSFEIQLRLPADAEFCAGQYLELLLDPQRAVPYSIASAPARLPEARLHIQDQGDGSLSREVLDHLRRQKRVSLRLPSGNCVLCGERLGLDNDLVLIAAGSGFAQMKSIMEQVVAEGYSNPVHFYWGVKSADQLYGEALIAEWQQAHPSFRFVAVVEDDDSWQGRSGYVHQAVLDDFDGLERAEVFVCGSPTMVYAVEDAFLPRGLRQGHIHSDVYSYAPRSAG